MTIPTEIAIATFLMGLVGWVAAGIWADPFVGWAGRGGGGVGFGFGFAPAGTSGKKGWSELPPELSAGGGGASWESSSPEEGGDEVTGNNGWWRILLVF